MILRPLKPEIDFEKIKTWITDERSHAMWCADRFAYPLKKENFVATLSFLNQNNKEVSLAAVLEDDTPVGFLNLSPHEERKTAWLKFVIIDPAYRGTGAAEEMIELVKSYGSEQMDMESLQLSVFSSNARAKRCYEKVGFKERKTDMYAFAYKDESWDRCYMMTSISSK